MDELREFEVPAEAAGTRLDVFLARSMPQWSRSQIQRLIAAGLVTVSGRTARKRGDKVEAGARITVHAERAELRARPEDLPLDIVFEDDDLVVVNKPAGMVVHVGAGVKAGTLVNALLHHISKLSETGGELRPGIVHRLDRRTSGLIVAAKNDVAHRALAAQFKSRRVRKTYTLLVHGRLEKERGEIRAPVGRDPVRRVRMKVGGIRPREALTAYRVLRRFPHFTLVAAEPRTGRTHQLRVHFAHLRHPVVGDTLYGAPGTLRFGGRETPTLERNFLHAASLEFQHPSTGEVLRLTAPLPAELESFLRGIEREDR